MQILGIINQSIYLGWAGTILDVNCLLKADLSVLCMLTEQRNIAGGIGARGYDKQYLYQPYYL